MTLAATRPMALVFASLQDLSGPASAMSRQVCRGMQLAVDECNRAGALAGASVRLVVADHAFNARQAVEAATAICQGERPLAFVANVGSGPNLAVMPVLEEYAVGHLFPLAAARALYEPVHRLRFASAPSYQAQMRAATGHVVRQFGARRVGIVLQDDAFGDEVARGCISGLSDAGLGLALSRRIRVGQPDLGETVDAIEKAGCDWVVLGTMVGDSLALLREVRRRGLTLEFLGSISTYTELMCADDADLTHGFWSVANLEIPHQLTADAQLRAWQEAYRLEAGEFPGAYSAHGYLAMRHVLSTLRRVSGEISPQSLCAALESQSLDGQPFGADGMRFAPGDHLGSRRIRLARIEHGRWQLKTGFIACTDEPAP